MKKIDSFEKKISKIYVNSYQLSKGYSKENIRKIVEILSENGVKFDGFRLSNSLDQPDHFFRIFPTLKDLYTYPIDDEYIDDFGLDCIYNDIKFTLTFNFAKNQVVTFTKGNVDLEDLLIQLEK